MQRDISARQRSAGLNEMTDISTDRGRGGDANDGRKTQAAQQYLIH